MWWVIVRACGSQEFLVCEDFPQNGPVGRGHYVCYNTTTQKTTQSFWETWKIWQCFDYLLTSFRLVKRSQTASFGAMNPNVEMRHGGSENRFQCCHVFSYVVS